ncbi:DUF6318 family protein [Micrococcus sp. 2A]|uniref:DUF6318 family protein n=1 Tax=Micrococcus sp. 2A TaxID=3142261 RepID=UPI00260F4C4C|nr:DUF6318 family protein [uncultured Micrococcus sp.]
MSITAPPRALPRRRPAQAASLAAALALALTACGGGDPAPTETTTTAPVSSTQAADTPTATATATAGASPSTPDGGTAPSSGSGSGPASATASGPYVPASAEGPAQNVPKPVMPEVMKEETQEGAEAAVKYFWETVYYMQQTGDAGLEQEISGPTCKFCEHHKNSIMKLHGDGGWMVSETATIHSAITRPSKNGYTSTILLNMSKEEFFEKSGDEIAVSMSDSEDKAPWIAQSRYDKDLGHWTIAEMAYEGVSQN